MGLLVLWILCGVICAVIASNKGRSGGGWFLLGCLLGPLGIVLALVVGKDEKVVAAAALKAGTAVKCPACAELIKPEANVCKHCQTDLGAYVWTLKFREGVKTNCPRCDKIVKLDPEEMAVGYFDCPRCERRVRFAQGA